MRKNLMAQQSKDKPETNASKPPSQSTTPYRFTMGLGTANDSARRTMPNKNGADTIAATDNQQTSQTRKKNNRQEFWTCPACSKRCYIRRKTCPQCDRPRPPGHPKDPSPPNTSENVSVNGGNKPPNKSSTVDQRERDFKNSAPGGAVPFRKVKTTGLYDPEPILRISKHPYHGPPREDETASSAWERKTDVMSAQSDQNSKRVEAVDRQAEKVPAPSKQDFKHAETFNKLEEEADLMPASSKRYARLSEAFEPDDDVKPKKSNKQSAKRQNRKPSKMMNPDDEFFDDEFDDYAPRSKRRKDKKRNDSKPAGPTPIFLPEFISVRNLAEVLAVEVRTFMELLEDMGFEDTKNTDILDAETAGLIATEFNFEPVFSQAEDDLTAAPPPEDKSILPSRPPVVTIMGHVDHGKTTILDWLRKSSVAASEHGGITQHIGAFSVPMPSGKLITFLDTPGHAAFLDMRRRGADVTDMVILVVAADDSVKPQTIEAIKHAKEAKVPVIVAINKVDKDNADPEKVKQDLARNSVDVEDFGGDVQAVCVSGKTGQGMLELEEAAVTLSELLDHRAEVDGNAEGFVIEATAKKGGRVATVLVKRGTLRPGDIVVAGPSWARIRTLRNEAGVLVDEATPGTPVQVDGWKEQPSAGSEVLQAPSEQKAKDAVAVRLEKVDNKKLSQDMEAINESRRVESERRQKELDAAKKENASSVENDSTEESSKSGPKGVPFFVKADVSGSAEALVNSISALGNSEVFPKVLRSAVGPISEFDVQHAAVAKGHVISFNQPIEPSLVRMAEMEGVRIMDHNIIYELIDDVKDKLSEHLPPIVTHRVTGEAEISEVFNISKKGKDTTAIAGCKVRNGLISRNHKTRVLRGTETVYDG